MIISLGKTCLLWLAFGLILLFSIANKHTVTLSFDPFPTSPDSPLFLSLSLPLFVILFIFFWLGTLFGWYFGVSSSRKKFLPAQAPDEPLSHKQGLPYQNE